METENTKNGVWKNETGLWASRAISFMKDLYTGDDPSLFTKFNKYIADHDYIDTEDPVYLAKMLRSDTPPTVLEVSILYDGTRATAAHIRYSSPKEHPDVHPEVRLTGLAFQDFSERR